MAKISLSGRGDLYAVARQLEAELIQHALSCSLVDRIERRVNGQMLICMVFDKYYMRTSNRASLTVTLLSDGDMIYADAIGSGGGEGAIFRFSWGADENFAGTAERILRSIGLN